MLFAQLTFKKSLRELVTSFNSLHNCHYHIGASTVTRSTLSYANSTRSTKVFSMLLRSIIQNLGRKQGGEVKDLLYLLDSTPISLKGLGFDKWAAEKRNPRTQGLKIHVGYMPAEALLSDFEITHANINDISAARDMPLKKHVTYVFDKGYCDYDWWLQIENTGSKFVTRAKKNISLKIEEIREIKDGGEHHILEDAIVTLNNKSPRARKKLTYLKPLRRVSVARPEKEPLILITNDLASSAQEIAETYKRRWLIELLFKWLKQNLSLKTFLGRSKNAVTIQILCSLIAYSLIASIHNSGIYSGSLRELLIIIRTKLFQPISFESPPPMRRKDPEKTQLALRFSL